MKNNIEQNSFRENEIVVFNQWEEGGQQSSKVFYPKVGGRLRLAHEENEKLSISSQILKFDAEIAIVSANTTTDKGSFSGIGMASTIRDQEIAPAILELAETRAIARSLRFAGYGVEYCSAEEVSHLKNNGKVGHEEKNDSFPDSVNLPDLKEKLSPKQLDYILALGKKKDLDIRLLEKMSFELHGVRVGNLLKSEASLFIDHILAYQSEETCEN